MFTSHYYTTTSVQCTNMRCQRDGMKPNLYRYTVNTLFRLEFLGRKRESDPIDISHKRTTVLPSLILESHLGRHTRKLRRWPEDAARVMVRKRWLTGMSRSKKCIKKPNERVENISAWFTNSSVGPRRWSKRVTAPSRLTEGWRRLENLSIFYFHINNIKIKKLPNNNKDVYLLRVHSECILFLRRLYIMRLTNAHLDNARW